MQNKQVHGESFLEHLLIFTNLYQLYSRVVGVFESAFQGKIMVLDCKQRQTEYIIWASETTSSHMLN